MYYRNSPVIFFDGLKKRETANLPKKSVTKRTQPWNIPSHNCICITRSNQYTTPLPALNLTISALCILSETLTNPINNVQGQRAEDATQHYPVTWTWQACSVSSYNCFFLSVFFFGLFWVFFFFNRLWWPLVTPGPLHLVSCLDTGKDTNTLTGGHDISDAMMKSSHILTLGRRCPPVWRWCCPLIQNPRSWPELLQVQGITI